MKDNLELLLPRILFLLWLWLFAIVVFTGWPRLWGMIPLGPTEGAWALPVALICTVMIFGPGTGFFAWVNKWLTYSKKNINRRSVRLIGLVFLYLIIFFIAWILRSENHFMGDGWLYISEVERPFYLSITRPLDFFIHQLFHRIVQGLGLGGGEAAYALLHCFLCPVFLWICWHIAGLITSDFLDRAVLGLLMASTTVLQLFVGYVECYTLLNLWVVIYIYAGIKYLCNRQNAKNPWVPTIIFVLVFLSHRSGVVLGPSLLFLWLYRLLSGRSTNNKLLISFLLVALIFPLPLVFGLITKSPSVSLLVPLWEPNANSQAPYSLFSIEHLWEKLNFLLLICPAAVVALPVITSKWRLLKRCDNSSFIFVFWCCAGSVFFSFILNPLLGIRDWDLLSISGVPLALFSGWCLLTVLKKGRPRDAFLGALAVAATVHGMAWVWVNADIDRGVDFLDHIRHEDYHQSTGKLNLGGLLRGKGYLPEAINQFRLVTGLLQPRAILNIGEIFLEMEIPDSLIKYYHQTFPDMDNAVPSGVSAVCIRLSLAFDMKECPDSANYYYLLPLRKGFEYSLKDRNWWIKSKKGVYNRYSKYDVKNLEALKAMLRFFTIANDNANLAKAYNLILDSKVSPDEWQKLIEFARLNGQKDYVDLLVKEVTKHYPDLMK